MAALLRWVLSVVLVTLALAVIVAQPLTLPALPYDYDALEPVISAQTMRNHHLNHHAAYTEKVNAVLVELRSAPASKALAKEGLDFILAHIHNLSLPLTDAQRTQLRNNGGGYINHELYFANLAPPAVVLDDGGERVANASLLPDALPSAGSQVLAALTATFASFEAFQQQLSAAAASVFGSGWAWLIVDGTSGALRIETTANQDSPLMEGRGHTGLLALDLWEHAYLLDHLSQRRDYVAAFFKIIAWDEVERRLMRARAGKRGGETAPPRTHTELR